MDRVLSTFGEMYRFFDHSTNVVSSDTISVNGVVVRGNSLMTDTGIALKAQADGGLQATLPDGRVIDVGTAECVLLCGKDVHRAIGAITFTADTVNVHGTGIRLTAPTAKRVEVSGTNADVTVNGPCDSVVCSGANSTVRCGNIDSLTQSGVNASVYGNKRKKRRDDYDYSGSDTKRRKTQRDEDDDSD